MINLIQTDLKAGLSPLEVENSRKAHGSNQILQKPSEPLFVLFLKKFLSASSLLLLFTIGCCIGLKKYYLACLISVMIFINGMVAFVQEYRSREVIVKLSMRMLALAARTLRSCKWEKVKTDELVVGDVVRLRPGVKLFSS
jgi:magnesium-transporting ATPase (P-type)